jgi:hypothetical protein
MSIFKSTVNWFPFSKTLARAIGTLECVFLMALVERGESTGDEWFVYSYAEIEASTAITPKQSMRLVKVLVEKEYIEVKGFGLPKRQHFKLNRNKILSEVL